MALNDLCDSDDVARVLRIPSVDAADAERVQKAIETASAWVRLYLRQPYLGTTTPGSRTFYDVRDDGYVPSPAVPTDVKAAEYAGGTPRSIGANAWTHDGTGVRLRVDQAGYRDPRYTDAEGLPRTYAVVVVEFDADEAVSPIVRDGTAIAAGAVWTRGPRLTKGLQGENIGDYSYTVASLLDGDPFFEQAKAMLRPLRSRDGLVP